MSRYRIAGVEYEEDEVSSKTELKVLNNLEYTPRIPRHFVSFYKKYPCQTKLVHFLYSYAYKAIKQGKYQSKDENNKVYTGIELTQSDFRRWFPISRKRRERKLEKLKEITTCFNFEMKEDKLIIDFRINFGDKMDYLAELSKQECRLTNNQLLFLKLIQASSRIEQVFNFNTLVEMRMAGNKTNLRIVKRDVLKDLKLFQEIGVIPKVEFLDGGRQVKLRVWKERKSGVGRRQTKSRK